MKKALILLLVTTMLLATVLTAYAATYSSTKTFNLKDSLGIVIGSSTYKFYAEWSGGKVRFTNGSCSANVQAGFYNLHCYRSWPSTWSSTSLTANGSVDYKGVLPNFTYLYRVKCKVYANQPNKFYWTITRELP